MSYRSRMLLAGLIPLVFAISLEAQTKPAAAKTGTAKAWTPPKTPWGDPDLQGTYTSDDCIGTPMSRPANLGEKRYYTEEELAQAEARIARQAENDKQQFVAANAAVSVGPPGHWGERARRPCKQTSLVIDPPDGRTPALTPEAQARGGRGQRAPELLPLKQLRRQLQHAARLRRLLQQRRAGEARAVVEAEPITILRINLLRGKTSVSISAASRGALRVRSCLLSTATVRRSFKRQVM